MNDYRENIPGTLGRDQAEAHLEAVRQQGGMFVEAVRVTRMPMIVTDAVLPGNPIIFANAAFIELSGYPIEELLGQDPHFMNGEDTDPEAIRRYEEAITEGRDETLEILQYRKDGTPFRSMLFASPLGNGQGTVTNHFLSYLDITRRFDAEEDLRKANDELEERVTNRTRELQDALGRLEILDRERELLMKEVNHRAKNSLAIAASLLSMQGRRQTDPAIKNLFEEARERLNSMARVHDLLSRSEGVQNVDVAAYMGDLCNALRALTDEGRVQLEARVEEGILVDADTAVPLGIVITEVVTNAVKYAFPAPEAGTILAEARRSGPGMLELRIRDDGVGATEAREGSLGYGLVRSLVKQIGGVLTVDGNDGVSVTVTFPDPLERPRK